MLEAVLSLGLISVLFVSVWQLHTSLNSEARELSRLQASLIYEAYCEISGKGEPLRGGEEKLLTTKTTEKALLRTYLKIDPKSDPFYLLVAESKTREGRPVVTSVNFYPRGGL